MRVKAVVLLTAAFVLVFFAMGIPYWQIPYAKASLPDSLYGPSLGLLLAAAVIVRLFSDASFRKTAVVIGSAVPASVMARVVVETALDPTSHNLWPFEMIIASAVGLAMATVGSLVGGLLAKLLKKRAFHGGA
ncbi:MAG: hypothetical protein M0009_11250 [Deltaproteobacteria bacterium]|nr:hypothetical protein [Deltaproteobacteria bacterium]